MGMFARVHVAVSRGMYQYKNMNSKDQKYSMILTGFAMFHAKYLDLYQTKLPKELKDFVDKNTNCEDISMNAVIASHLMSEYHLKTPVCPAVHFRHEGRLKKLENYSGAQFDLQCTYYV